MKEKLEKPNSTLAPVLGNLDSFISDKAMKMYFKMVEPSILKGHGVGIKGHFNYFMP